MMRFRDILGGVGKFAGLPQLEINGDEKNEMEKRFVLRAISLVNDKASRVKAATAVHCIEKLVIAAGPGASCLFRRDMKSPKYTTNHNLLTTLKFMDTIDVFIKKVPSRVHSSGDQQNSMEYEIFVPTTERLLKIVKVPITGFYHATEVKELPANGCMLGRANVAGGFIGASTRNFN